MKCVLVFISVFLCIGISHAFLEEVVENSQAKTPRKVAKPDLNTLSHLEALIIANCKTAGDDADIANELRETFDEMKSCLSNMTLTSKSEYLSNMESCAEKSVKKATECLPKNRKYFPKLVLDLFKTVSSFSYDKELFRTELVPCLTRINTDEAQRSYLECVSGVAKCSANKIQSSARSFCDMVLPVLDCHSDMLRKYCDDSEVMRTLRKNYVDSYKNVCDVASADPVENGL